jgi:hypothetical protein
MTTKTKKAPEAKQTQWFDQAEYKLLFTFADLAKKAGTAAQSACEKAQLTQGEHEAQTLLGYAEEARMFMDKREDDTVQLSRGHLEALKTGASLYLQALAKSEKTDEALLLDVSDHEVRRDEAITLARKLGGGDLFDNTNVTVTFGDEKIETTGKHVRAAAAAMAGDDDDA